MNGSEQNNSFLCLTYTALSHVIKNSFTDTFLFQMCFKIQLFTTFNYIKVDICTICFHTNDPGIVDAKTWFLLSVGLVKFAFILTHGGTEAGHFNHLSITSDIYFASLLASGGLLASGADQHSNPHVLEAGTSF